MKKHFLLLLAALFAAVSSWAQVLNEGFEGTLFPPSDWTAVNVSGSVSWARYTSDSPIGTACASVNYATYSHQNWLITPKLVPAMGQNLTFWIKTPSCYANTTVNVKVSTTTNEVSAFTTTSLLNLVSSSSTNCSTGAINTTWKQYSVDLSAYVGQQVYVGFQVIDTDGQRIMLDDVAGVNLYVPSCPKPTGVSATATDARNISVLWTSSATEFLVEYKTGSGSWIELTPNPIASPATIPNLTPETEYQIRVKAICGIGDESDYVNVASVVKTPVSCPKPTGLSKNNVLTDRADISWVQGGTETEWLLQYKKSSEPESAYIPVKVTNNPPYQLIGLDPSTNYVVRVKAVCAVADSSQFTSSIPFTTACGAITISSNWLENFNSYSSGALPNCWTRTTPYGSYPAVTSSYGISLEFHGNATQMIATPEFVNEVNTLEIEFDLRREDVTSSGTFEVGVLSDPSNASTFVSIKNVTDLITVADKNYDRYIVSLASAPIGYHYIAFRQTTTSNYWYWLDNLDVHLIPACPKPTLLEVSNITTESADISWTAGSDETKWVVEYSLNSNFLTIEGSEEVETDPSTTLQGLTAEQTYYVRVKADCDGSESVWVTTTVYTSYCIPPAPTTTTYYLNSVKTTEGHDNLNYTNSIANSAGWHNNKSAVVSNYPLESTSIALYQSSNTGYFYCWIDWNDDLVFDNTTEKIFGTTDYTSSYTGTITIPVGTPAGDYIMRVACSYLGEITSACTISENGHGDYVDFTFRVLPSPACPRPTVLKTNDIIFKGAILEWTQNGEEEAWIVEYKKASEEDTEYVSIPVSENPYTLNGLDPTTQYSVRVKADCEEDGESGYSNTLTFYTTPVNDICNNAVVLSCGTTALAGSTIGASAKTITGNTASKYGVFYTFEGDGLETTITCVAAPGYDHSISIFTGSCEELTLVVEKDGASSGGTETHTFISAVGTTYYVYIAYYGESGAATNTGTFTISRTCVCAPPTEVAVVTESIRTTTASVGFTPGIATDYEYFVTATTAVEADLLGITPTEVTENPILLTGLTANTSYKVWVRSVCDVDDYSRSIATANFTTLGQIVTVPYAQDFSDPAPEFLFKQKNATSDRFAIGSATTGGNPAPALYLSNDGGVTYKYTTHSNWAIAELAVDFGDFYSYKLSFDWKCVGEISSGTDYDYGRVYLLNATENISSESLPDGHLKSLNLIGQDTWQQFEMEFNNSYANKLKKLVFAWRTDYSSIGTGAVPLAIDNIVIQGFEPPVCYPPVITVKAATTNSADITFTDVNGADAWQYIISKSNTVDFETAEIVDVDENPFTIPDLEVNTLYYIWVRTVCEEGLESTWTKDNFKTACEITLPFTENFESYSTGTISNIDCWFLSGNFSVVNYTDFTGKVLRFNSSKSDDRVVRLPVFAEDVNNLKLSFKLKREDVPLSGNFDVGYLTDPSNENTFTAVYSNILTNTSILSWEKLLSTFPAGVKNIAFRQGISTSTYSYYYWIDDINVRKLGTENDIIAFSVPMKTGDAVIDAVNHTVDIEVAFSADETALTPTITVSPYATIFPLSGVAKDFTNPVIYTVTAEDGTEQIWTVTVTKAAISSAKDIIAFNIPNQVGATVITTIDANNATIAVEMSWYQSITALSPAIIISSFAAISPASGVVQNFTTPVTYTVTAEDGSQKEYVVTVSLAPMPVVTLPYKQNFSNANAALDFTFKQNTTDAFIVGSATGNAAPALYVSSDGVANTYSKNNAYALAELVVDFGNFDDYILSFDWKCEGESDYDYGRVYITDVATNITSNTLPSGHLGSLNMVGYGTTWRHFEITLAGSIYSGTTKKIVFAWRTDGSTIASNPLAIDNIVISACKKPVVSAGASTLSTAIVNWTHSSATDFVIEWGEVGFIPGTNAEIGSADVSGLSYTIEDLMSGTNYDAYVMAQCSVGNESDWSIVKLQTACEAIGLPYTENFDSYSGTTYSTAGPVPTCWYTYAQSGSTTRMPHITGSGDYNYPHSGTNALTFTGGSNYGGTDTYAVLPMFDVPIEQLVISFLYRYENMSYGKLSVGYITGSQNNIASYTPLFYPTETSSITPTEYAFISAGADLSNATYIAIRWNYTGSSFYSAGIDDINVDIMPCLNPVVSVDNVTSSSAVVSWTNSTATNFKVEWGVEGFTPGIDDGINSVDVSASSYTINGLDAGYYDVYVKAICGTENTSEWIKESFVVFEPTVITKEATDITKNSAVLNKIVVAGLKPITEEGFEYKLEDEEDWLTVDSDGILSDLAEEMGYTFRAFATTEDNIYYGETLTFTTLGTIKPTVITQNATDVTTNSAVLHKSVTQGEKPIETEGFEYSVEGEENWLMVDSDGILLDLEEETVYEFRAFATTEDGIYYGQILTFKTQTTGIGVIFDGNIALYPNPAKQITTLQIDGLNTVAQVVITDLAGKTVDVYNLNASETQLEINVSNIADGTYFVKVISDKAIPVQKLVVKK